jgi:hypothetical protein
MTKPSIQSTVVISSVFLATILYWSSMLGVHMTAAAGTVATLTLHNSALGSVEEGETIHYSPSNQSDLDDILSVSISEANVFLHLDSNLGSLSETYKAYSIVMKFDSVPEASSHKSGDIACALSLASPDYSSISLDAAGTWTFDCEIAATASSISSDTVTAVTITVTAEAHHRPPIVRKALLLTSARP